MTGNEITNTQLVSLLASNRFNNLAPLYFYREGLGLGSTTVPYAFSIPEQSLQAFGCSSYF